ncbi:MAG: hypothetical protein IJP23_07265 [Oscillospiraceae bacterium]|nr:hypothetical protein [Oscillospiraceae bacterium]
MNKRFVETVKTVLIALLALLAVVLFFAVRYYSSGSEYEVGGLHFLQKDPVAETTGDISAAAMPAAVSVRTPEGCFVPLADGGALEDIYTRCTPALREALGTAGEPVEIDRHRWQTLLSQQGVYFAFDYPVELSALASWLGTDFSWQGSASALLMTAGEEDTLWLYVNHGDSFSGYATQAKYPSAELEGIKANGGEFACLLSDDVYKKIDPDALVVEEMDNYFPTLTVGLPLSDSELREDILEHLGVNPYADYSVFTGGMLYLYNDFRLAISSDGTFELDVYATDALALEDAPVYDDPAAAAVEAARRLVQSTIAESCAEARVMCTGVEGGNGVYTVTFAYYVNGVRVSTGGSDAAKITVTEGKITAADMIFRSYTESGEESYVLSPGYAAALIPGGQMKLVYTDSGGTAAVNWQG